MVSFDKVQILVCRVRYELARSIRQRDRILLQFCTKLGNLEDSKTNENVSEQEYAV
jgi:hypothetical protein